MGTKQIEFLDNELKHAKNVNNLVLAELFSNRNVSIYHEIEPPKGGGSFNCRRISTPLKSQSENHTHLDIELTSVNGNNYYCRRLNQSEIPNKFDIEPERCLGGIPVLESRRLSVSRVISKIHDKNTKEVHVFLVRFNKRKDCLFIDSTCNCCHY